MKFKAKVIVECDTQEQAEEVLANRLYHEEEYGFNYYIDYFEVEPVEEGETSASTVRD